ncbi:MAG: hypothetical protein KKC64_04250 [Spirochaetes bacterium]|nr:hypothetical protein [Spirochaetota bacterium]
MKRILFVVLLLALLVPAFGQDVSGSVEGSSVLRPDVPYFSTYNGALKVSLPASLLSFVSNGIWRDEIDNVVLNPLQLAQYSGYTLWTAYGNFEYFNRAAALNTPQAITGTDIKPFATTVLNDANIGNFQLGFAMPLPLVDGWRLGLLGGTQFTRDNNLTSGLSVINNTSTVATDVGTIAGDATGTLGTVSYTTVTTTKAEDETTTSIFRLGAGLNMGSMAASLYAFSRNVDRKAGGSYEYTWTKGTDTYELTSLAEVMTRTNYYGAKAFGDDVAGTKAEGKAGNWPSTSNSLFGGLFQLPLQLIGYAMPVTAKLGFDLSSGAYGNTMPVRFAYTTAYDQVVTEAAKTSSYTWTGFQNIAAAWQPGAGGAFDYTPALVEDRSASNYATFAANIGAWIDPVIPAGVVTLKPRLGLDYQILFDGNNVKQVAYSSASISNPGADANNTWSYSNIDNVESSVLRNNFRFDVGALAEFKNQTDSVALGIGLYVHPTMLLSLTNTKTDSVVAVRSWTNSTGDTEATLATVLAGGGTEALRAATISNAAQEGTSTLTTTTTFTSPTINNVFGNTVVIPVSVRIGFFKNKLVLVGGYEFEHKEERTYSKSGNNVPKETLIVANSAGTTVYDSSRVGGDPAAEVIPDAGTTTTANANWDTIAGTTWAGSMNFMFRWSATENMVVDLSGSSVKAAFAALDGLFSLNGGIMPSMLWDFVDSLQMSVTFKF